MKNDFLKDFNFEEVEKLSAGYDEPVIVIGSSRLVYASCRFGILLTDNGKKNFTRCTVYYDKEDKIVGLYFNNAANSVKNNFCVRIGGSKNMGFHLSSKAIVDTVVEFFKLGSKERVVLRPTKGNPEGDFWFIKLNDPKALVFKGVGGY